MQLIFMALCAFLSPFQTDLQTSETLIVTANRQETPQREVGSAVSVITAVDIAQRGITHLADALRLVPGLDVVCSGGPGKTTSLFMRGAASNHVLFLIDGVEMQDPITPGGVFDLANLDVSGIERIEVVRGPQSTLYGSDALAGVVHIISKSQGERPTATLDISAGAYGTQQLRAHAGTTRGALKLSGAYSHYVSDGFSAARPDQQPLEDDGYRNRTLTTGLQYTANRFLVFNLKGRFSKARTDLDAGGGPSGDDPNYASENEQSFLTAGVRASHREGRWIQALQFALTDHDRLLENQVDAVRQSASRGDYGGTKHKLTWQHDFYFGNNALLAGLSHEEESGESIYRSESVYGPFESVFKERETRNSALFVQGQFHLRQDLALTLGGRLDDHSLFGDHGTGRLTAAWQWTRHLALKGSMGTGFKAPSLYQLYSAYGNLDLDAEESKGWDLGFDGYGESFSMNFRWFDNVYQQLIEYDGATRTYHNISGAHTKGAELNLSRRWGALQLAGSYTFTEARAENSQEQLVRRPRHKGSLSLRYALAHANLTLDWRHVGSRAFTDFSAWPYQRVNLQAYEVLDLAGQWYLSKQLKLFGRLENLTDEDYQEVLGYSTPGASAYVGLSLNRQ